MLLVALFCGMFMFNIAFAQTMEFTVKKGDNFWTLAKKYQVNHAELIKLNHNKLRKAGNPDLIYPGDKFLVEIADNVKVEKQSQKIIRNGNVEDISTNAIFSSYGTMNAATSSNQSNQGPVVAQQKKLTDGNKLFFIAIVGSSLLTGLFLMKHKRKRIFWHSRFKLPSNELNPVEIICVDDPFEILPKQQMQTGGVLDTPKPEVMIVENLFPDVDSLGKKVVGITGKNEFCLTDESGGMKGDCKHVARFIADLYGNRYKEFVLYIKKPVHNIFQMQSLNVQERSQLEGYIDIILSQKMQKNECA
ncbi:MAG: LysM peptidoglycan-binding domain-containing protein [Candidatus Moranbacteria bacterium]|nr:LysM peptidoglycan-binding domain-containing protein [Candidatus Moranbacteria bacterium]